MEIKTTQMRRRKDYLFRACYSKGVSHNYLHLAEIQEQGGECESLVEKKEGFNFLIGGYGLGGARGGLFA